MNPELIDYLGLMLEANRQAVGRLYEAGLKQEARDLRQAGVLVSRVIANVALSEGVEPRQREKLLSFLLSGLR